MGKARVGMLFDYEAFPAAAIGECARRCESAGIDQLLVVEDCFHTASASIAGAALAVTEELTVAIGVMPAVARNPAITAMEIATLASIGPGRLVAGIGHGIPAWMDRIGARTTSPLTTLEETITVVKQLLSGAEVTFDGHHVHLDAVRLDEPPASAPPVLAGVMRHKSLELAGRIADGVILAYAGPTYADWSLEHTGRRDGFGVVTDTVMSVATERRQAYVPLCDFVAELTLARWPSLTVVPFFDEMFSKVSDGGPQELVEMPADYWREIGAIGTIDDAHEHIAALDAVGVEHVAVFSARQLDDPWDLIPLVAELNRR